MKQQLKTVKSAKQLTVTYFSIIAFAIITLHFSLLDATLEDFEQINANNRLQHAKAVAEEVLQEQSNITQFAIPPFTHAYLDPKQLPPQVRFPENTPWDKAFEIRSQGADDTEYFAMKTRITDNKTDKTLYLLFSDYIYEISEEQVFLNQLKQLGISILLLVVSFVVVLKASARLTNPLTQLANDIDSRNAGDLSPIAPPSGINSREVLQLVDSFNLYVTQINELLNRERSFNRYASHELRTPLMVMKGATSLLGQSNAPAFVAKQQKRLEQATSEMNDFVTTLLSLTREEDMDNISSRQLDRKELEEIASAHTSLLSGKHVDWYVEAPQPIEIKMPENAFKILLGNLIKNAFAFTEQGHVIIRMTPSAIMVEDTGTGLKSNETGHKGYGLGLLIAADICRKYHWHLHHETNQYQGCTATISLQPNEKPNGQTE
ncbi:HAMP domain-containing sensor histidine kinase (plasmid) [Photobacterium sp. DA100]|uniref:sensor histidine kinase n=1 Tax=Photobacterium sp. DA100 TaxID=3027472 RepID=UPI002478F0CA|nr:HAMP domain-containing sensor histidine kinase [Photobacterium sp. DA100]WEM45599.1 HAMP domain-containing sensor histidine kinase [Photobacterium sp. DA100]